MKKILMIGAVTADLACYVEELPKSDVDIETLDTNMRLSGFGWNLAHVAESLNLPYQLITSVGSGFYGEAIQEGKGNIVLPEPGKYIHGCTYTMIDRKGRYNTMTVPGEEYDFIPALADPDDFSMVIVSGTELIYDGGDALIDFLQPFSGKIIFVPGNQGILADYDLLEEIFRLEPVVHITDTQLDTFTYGEEKDAVKAARILGVYTNRPVVVYMKDGSSIYVDEEEDIFVTGDDKNSVDRSGSEEAHAGAYLCGILSGLETGEALQFANQYASYVSAVRETVIPVSRYEMVRGELAKRIMNGH